MHICQHLFIHVLIAGLCKLIPFPFVSQRKDLKPDHDPTKTQKNSAEDIETDYICINPNSSPKVPYVSILSVEKLGIILFRTV